MDRVKNEEVLHDGYILSRNCLLKRVIEGGK